MILRTSILLFLVTSAMAAVSSQAPSHQDRLAAYRMAVELTNPKKDCTELKKLAQDKSFSLNELALIRHTENCNPAPRWDQVVKGLKNPILKPFAVRAQFDREIEKRHFGNAYRIFNANKNVISLNKKDFDTMASRALKTKLTPKEKRHLRTELQRRSPRFIPTPKKSQYLKVAKDYRDSRNFEKALYYYRKIINDPKMSYNNRWRAFRGARATYKLERWSRMKNYIKASRQWAHFLDNKYKWSAAMTGMHHDANIAYIRTLWTEKGQKLATKELDRLEKQLKGRHSLQMIYWLKGRMAEERKKYDLAVSWLKKAANEKPTSLRDRDRVLWSLAWNQRRIKRYAESQKNLQALKKSTELTFFAKTKYLYWQAENLISMGERKEAEKALERLTEFDLYGYYGALAFRKLKRPFPKPPRPTVSEKDMLSFFDKKDRTFFRDLVAVEELEVSEALTLDKVKTKKSWNTSRWVNYLNLLQKAGAYKAFFLGYHRLPPKKQLDVIEEHPYLLFPEPYKKQVLSSARNTRVSAALIYSIMKQESGFDVRARSHADAFGLLQLIPQVAKRAAERMPSVAYENPYDLYKPSVIIPLGANNLHHLFSKFDNNFILSVASYNASENAVKGWIKSRFHGDPITFIEDIPYEETKGYVKLVMRNYITYNRFDNDTDEPFVFPESCLAGLENFKTL